MTRMRSERDDIEGPIGQYVGKKSFIKPAAKAGDAESTLKSPTSRNLPPEGEDIESRLTKLKAIFDKGLITKDECEKKQGEIL